MKDYILQFKFKNGPMLRAMRAKGIETAAQLSRLCGVSQASIGSFLNFKKTPINKCTGEFLEIVLRIADALQTLPEMLFPEQHLKKALEDNKGEVEISLDQMLALTEGAYDSPESLLLAEENNEGKSDALESLMGTLGLRERRVIEMRFGLNGNEKKTLDEVGSEFAVTGERIRRIEEKAFRKMRHPGYNKKLREYL